EGLVVEESMVRSGTGARVIRRAQAKAEVFSGNSEMKGATHWMNTNWDTPRLTARPSMAFRKGSATSTMMTPPTTKRPRTAIQRLAPVKDSAQRDTAGTSSASSTVSE